MKFQNIILSVFVAGCSATWHAPDNFIYIPVQAGAYQLATWQNISDNTTPIHIYIEGDGHAFDARGRPTNDPTPHSAMLREMAGRDTGRNVVYMARPCQFIRSDACKNSDWTNGRFAPHIIDAMATAVKSVAGTRPIILVGYSGGAMVSGLIIQEYPDINVQKWITIAGVLNHNDWTEYFGDTPLTTSKSLDGLPHIPQTHYLAPNDKTVPNELSLRMINPDDVIYVPNASHNDFGDFVPDFTK